MLTAAFIKEINSNKNNLSTDFTAELIAIDLIKKGVDPQKIFIVPNGVIGKSSAKDVEVVRLERSIYTLKEYVYILSNRAGIYDTLPEGLFHEQYSYNHSDFQSRKKQTNQEEKRARKFFLPFEIVLNKYKIGVTYQENIASYENLAPIIHQLARNWPIFDLLDERQSVLFLHTIPMIHQIRNKYDLVSNFLSLLLGAPVVVILKQKTVTARVNPEFSLSEFRLGVSSVLGGISSETIYAIHVQIGPIEDENLSSFVSKSRNDVVLDEIFLWLFDCQIAVEKEVLAINKPKQRPSAYYLGINTFLS